LGGDLGFPRLSETAVALSAKTPRHWLAPGSLRAVRVGLMFLFGRSAVMEAPSESTLVYFGYSLLLLLLFFMHPPN